MLGRLFRGELTVTQTYWGGFVGFNIAIRILLYAIGGWQLRQMLDGNEDLAINVTLAIVGVGVLWSIAILRAHYIAMYNDRVPGFWSLAGCVLIVVGICTYFWSAMQIMNPSLTVGAAAIRQEFVTLNASLPQDIGPGVTIESAVFTGDALIYDYKVIGQSGGVTGNVLMPQSEVDGLCADMEGYFKGPVEEIAFRYTFTNEMVERVITRAECGFAR